MTFQEALDQLRKEGDCTYWSIPMVAMAEQIEANRLAIQELCKSDSELLKVVKELLAS